MQRKQVLAFGFIFVFIISGLLMFAVLDDYRSSNIIRVACVGDSITEKSGYTNKLQTMLGVDYKVGNFGVSGSTVSMNSKIPYVNQSQFQKAQDFKPDIVVIMLGTNDANPAIAYSESNFEHDFTRIIDAFQHLQSNPEIIVVDSPPIFATNTPYNNSYLVDSVIPKVDSLADQMNLPTVDMYRAFGNHSDYFMDGIHPNSDGSSLIASTMYDALISVENSKISP
jgi:lysophospholipase L1-like esterase